MEEAELSITNVPNYPTLLIIKGGKRESHPQNQTRPPSWSVFQIGLSQPHKREIPDIGGCAGSKTRRDRESR